MPPPSKLQRIHLVTATFVVPALATYLLYTSLRNQTEKTTQAQAQEVIASMNVFKKPLALFSKSPMTGFYRDGYCRSGPRDFGNHAVAGIVSEEFLDFTASQGNDLRIAGLSEGCKWCLCTSRWLEALLAFEDGRISEKGVPKVVLEATHESALNKVDLDTFKRFATKSEVNGQ